MCELHGSCARYAAIDGSRIPSSDFMDLCTDGHGGRPMYIPILDAARVHLETARESLVEAESNVSR
jgi:hypothetical protein